MSGRLRKVLLATSAIVPLGVLPAAANPLGGQVVGGSANVQGQGTANVTVNQSTDKAIINWQSFSLGSNDKTQFVQPSANSVVLNRVTGAVGPSTIDGILTANGHVFLVNPDGILFGPHSVINTGSLLATTSDIRNADFMAGRYLFNIPGRPDASIVNQGSITATGGGFAALVAPGVRNTGTITATLGTIALAAGNAFTLDFYGDKLITLAVGDQIAGAVKDVATGKPLDALVKNEGKLSANGGRVELTAAAARQVVDAVINNTGVIEANSIGTRNGLIMLSAATGANKPAGAPKQVVKVSGTLSAAGKSPGGGAPTNAYGRLGAGNEGAGPASGGKIIVTGEVIKVTGARIDASGASGGGTVLIGGDWSGGHPNLALVTNQSAKLDANAIPTATTVTVDAATTIDVSATAQGNGGKAIVWSDGATTFGGTILARGGPNGGDGGFVETSGHTVNFSGINVVTSAPLGKSGLWLLDPTDLTIDIPAASTISNNLATTNVTVQTNADGTTSGPGTPTTERPGDIIVSAPILSWSGANSLTLSAFNNIKINAGVTIKNTGSGSLALRADNTGRDSGTILFPGGVEGGKIDFSKSTGTVSLFYNPTSNADVANGNKYQNQTTFSGITTSSPDRFTAYMLINSAADLQKVGQDLPLVGNTPTIFGSFALGKDVTINTDHPFTAFGPGTTLAGLFDGQGHAIDGLKFSGASPGPIGLFGFIDKKGVVRDLDLTNVSINITGDGPLFVGALAGQNTGTISNVSVTGTINGGPTNSGMIVGGLVGQNGSLGPSSTAGTITGSTSAVAITLGDGCFNNCNSGFNIAGGLVGSNVAGSMISNSSASGAIVVGANSFAGGLVGQNGTFIPSGITQVASPGTITDSSATGAVSSTGANVSLGGLAGQNTPGSRITNSFATGNVTASANLGPDPGNCFVSGNCQFISAGGLVGQNQGTIEGTGALAFNGSPCVIGASCATGDVFVGARGQGGGLVGSNDGIITNAFALGNVTGAAGLGDHNHTNLGGLVGNNQGRITDAFAFGNVGTFNTAFLQAGGLVGDNSGSILRSFAIGNVRAGNDSNVGGLVSGNSANTDNCPGCIRGDGFNSAASIKDSIAIGSVTAGARSLAGGLAGSSDGSIVNSTAFGAVSAGGNSIIGGLVGVLSLGATINNSDAAGAVSSTGANSDVGGLVGVSGGTIANSFALGPVSGTSDSILGGLVGANIGTITNSNTLPTSTATGSGPNNIMGGLVALNFGGIDQSVAAGAVAGGDNSVVGGFVGANATFINFAPGSIPGSSFPGGGISNSSSSGNVSGGANSRVGGLVGDNGGSITNSSATGTPSGGPGSQVGPQVGSTSGQPNAPTYPSIVQGCNDQLCTYLTTGIIGGPSAPPPSPPPSPPLVTPAPPQAQLVDKFSGNQGDPTQQTTITVVTQNTAPANAPGGKQGPPGGRADPPGIGDRNFTGVPPLGETRFRNDELVLQFRADMSADAIEAIARQFGLTILNSENVDLVGRKIYRLRITGGGTVSNIIRAMEAQKIAAIATPNYTFTLQQDLSGSTTREGDASQYVVDKLRLGAAHRLTKGENVLIAVIDSGVDSAHPDLDGVIADRLDAVGGAENPHAHGTGMAGAIASHRRLMGIAPQAKLLTVRAFGPGSTDAQGTTAQILKGLDWAVSKGARIINMSFAGPRDPMLQEAFKRLREKNILLIAAAGNAGPKSPPLFPGADPNVLAVTATDTDDNLFVQANRGRYIGVAAPGVDILVPAPGAGYQFTTGTSVAAAHVSGVAALLMAHKPEASVETIRAILLSTAKDLGPKGRDDQFGWGLVDPSQALSALDASAAPTR